MKFIKSLLLVFILSSAFNAQEENIVLKTATGDIEGTMLVPISSEKPALVLIIAGSGPTNRNGNQGEMENNSLKMLATDLGKNGIASVRFDKRGVGQSSDAGKDESELRFDTYVNDVNAWIDMLAKDKRFSKLIIAGHSEGSLIGMIAASRSKKTAAFISITGAGRPADEIIKEQLAKVPDNIKAILFPLLDKVKKGDTVSNVPPIYYAVLRPSIQPYMRSWFKYDPKVEIKKLKIPVLIVQGSTDIQVNETDAEHLFKSKPGAVKKIIPNMNHVLKTCESMDKELQKEIYSNSELPLNPEFVKELSTFISGIK